MAAVLQFPNEILAIIFSELDAQAFSALRLTSWRANQATLPAFTSRYFETRYVMLSMLSLQNLVEIAKHEHFGPAVRTIELCIDHFVKVIDLDVYTSRHEGDISQNEEDSQSSRCESQGIEEEKPSVNETAYHSLWEDQERIIRSGLAQNYIKEALAAFPNVRSISIDNAHRPWGARAHTQQTGLPPTNIDLEPVTFVGQVLQIALTGIIEGGCPLSRLAVMSGSRRSGIESNVVAFLGKDLECYKKLSSLAELALNISADPAGNYEDQWVERWSVFIGLFENLTKLDLMINYSEAFVGEINRFAQLAPKIALPQLQHFGLYGACCTEKELTEFWRRHQATLKTISLVKLRMTGGLQDWQNLFVSILNENYSLKLSVDTCL